MNLKICSLPNLVAQGTHSWITFFNKKSLANAGGKVAIQESQDDCFKLTFSRRGCSKV